ncbi:hypothetical protein BGZ95_011506 [Linnemannia exigua]|uniref:Uncharacterized protein n=1 Tax=Linnemannia exigua TaxID=604196 RepID=A0AAD4D9S5_9FUNG|nr:hypothetical protein BGZ95_011506 [Linnemannia exigua]
MGMVTTAADFIETTNSAVLNPTTFLPESMPVIIRRQGNFSISVQKMSIWYHVILANSGNGKPEAMCFVSNNARAEHASEISKALLASAEDLNPSKIHMADDPATPYGYGETGVVKGDYISLNLKCSI